MVQRPVRVALLIATAGATATLLIASPSARAELIIPLLVVGLAALAALVALERRAPMLSRSLVLGVAAGTAALAVARPPHGSLDLWSYAMYGRIAAVHHANPYVMRPSAFSTDRFLAFVRPGWRNTRSVYGPLFTGL